MQHPGCIMDKWSLDVDNERWREDAAKRPKGTFEVRENIHLVAIKTYNCSSTLTTKKYSHSAKCTFEFIITHWREGSHKYTQELDKREEEKELKLKG